MSLKFVSLNVKGLNSQYKRSALCKEAATQKADLLFVQETHFLSLKDYSFLSKHFPHVFYANTNAAKIGVLIAVRDSLNFQKMDIHADPNGRYLILVSKLDSRW